MKVKLDRNQRNGLLLVAVFFAAGVGAGVVISRLPADAGSLLSFSGSLLGAAITVIGAIILLEYQKYQAGNEARATICELLDQALQCLTKAKTAEMIPGTEDDYNAAATALTHLRDAQQRIVAAQNARKWFPATSAPMVRAYVQLEDLSIDIAAAREASRPAAMYNAMPDLDAFIKPVEGRVRLALAEMRYSAVHAAASNLSV